MFDPTRWFRRSRRAPQGNRPPSRFRPLLEPLEQRQLLAVFPVMNLNDSGTGSLRQALLNANSTPGADVITFQVAGIIRLTSGALPAVTNTVSIDGTTAPGFSGTPLVEINANHFGGLSFNSGSAGSSLKSLALVSAGSDGVTLNDANILVAGNYIGLAPDGTTGGGNNGNGLTINATSSNDTIGGSAARQRNVISRNVSNGIEINGSMNNHVLNNFIGTDVTGTLARGNGGDGILVTNQASVNTIGGNVTAEPPGTRPPDFSGVRPPQGNLISANGGDGILLTNGSTNNLLEGNFVGTTASGRTALGNTLDGVAIDNGSGNNTIAGTTATQDPFIFYNVLSGNGGNGLRVNNSNGTTIQANFFGLGSDDKAPVGNGLNGVLIEGTSSNTQFGGRIPLGNVTAANHLNGLVVQDTASNFQAFNTFSGIGAFVSYTNLGNGKDGVLITATGGNIQLLSNQVAENGNDGIEISGSASGVQVVENFIGVGTDSTVPLANQNNGVEIDGNANGNIIGGPGPLSVVPQNVISGNKGYGVAITGSASFNQIDFSDIGTDKSGTVAVPNGKGGVLLGSGTSRNAVGATDPTLPTLISGNTGDGLDLEGTQGNNVYGTSIGLDVNGNALPNTGNGILIQESTANSIGGNGTNQRNIISGNGANGIALETATDNQVQSNYIGTSTNGLFGRPNGANGILLSIQASGNTIGGTLPANPGGTKPVDFSGAMPPQGNLISGNKGNGVLLSTGANNNLLEGNFIGPSVFGDDALGNSLDGVAIIGANSNTLAGTVSGMDPFAYYNVVSGNGHNGLEIIDSDNTVINANYFGLGSNLQPVSNLLNGVVVGGSSSNTMFGGPIPLGNVVSANKQNGVVVQDTASNFLASNNFTGTGPFVDFTTIGNDQNGFLITSTGGNIVIEIGNIIGGNKADGIDIAGNAWGVQVVQDMIGVNTDGTRVLPNGQNGVEIGGSAHDNVIGGNQPDFSVVPVGTISANNGYGIAITGSAHDNEINFAYIGTDFRGLAGSEGDQELGNRKGGISLGAGTSATTIGSTDPTLPTVISGNVGDGIDISSSKGNTVIGTTIGVGTDGNALPNTGNGIYIVNGSNNTIGGTVSGAGNVIADNGGNGVFVKSGQGNGIRENSIFLNAQLGIALGLGANNNAPAPVLTSAVPVTNGLSVSGFIKGKAKTTYTIEVFADFVADPTGFGQGRFFLGSVQVTTNSAGMATFNFVAQTPPMGSEILSATATDSQNNTSQFSKDLSLGGS
ncbi:MAG TPA: right-handed parallel beta-helix repeat-containing protein [Gemmataceae bacterium]|nr:right-handed parallel beta-helix repeat-containing protein [Gemmataceae bacterium]